MRQEKVFIIIIFLDLLITVSLQIFLYAWLWYESQCFRFLKDYYYLLVFRGI